MDTCYETVFDAAHKLPPIWFLAIPALLLGVGIAILFFPGSFPNRYRGHEDANIPAPLRIIFGAVYTSIALAVTVGGAVAIAADWWDVHHGQRYHVAGVVEHFHPMPYEGHDDERFTVDGVHFAYSDYGVSSGFNHTRSHGGPISSGQRVRIAYVHGRNGNVIVKLQVACGDEGGPARAA